jgi:hypothetical protein
MNARVLRGLAATLVGMGLVVGSLELGSSRPTEASAGAPPAPYYREEELPGYPSAPEFPLGEQLAVNGLAVRISYLFTPHSAERVRDFYVAELERRGAETRVVRTSDGGFTVSGMVAGGRSHAVVVIHPQGKGSQVFPSIFPMSGPVGEPLTPDEDIPLSPTAVGVVKVAEKAGQPGEIITYQEPLLTSREAAQLVREQMTAKGWQVSGVRTLPDRGLELEATRGGRSARFTIARYQTRSVGSAVVAHYGPKGD